MTFDIQLVTINLVDRRADDNEICFPLLAFLGRRFAVDQVFGQTGSRFLARLRRRSADVTAARKKFGREPLFLVQLAVGVERREASDANLKSFLRVIKKPVNIRICPQLVDFGRARVGVKSEPRRPAPETAQDNHPQIGRVVANRSEDGRMKRMLALKRS